MESKNIYQRMIAITAELSTVAKNLEVGYGQSKYKAVGEADVLRAVKPLEVKHGVYSFPFSRQIVESGMIENEAVSNGQKVVKKSLYERIETVYRFVNVDKPDEFIDITTYGDGIDPQDKSVGKAMTYADKYALLKAYKIVTGDDPDQEASGDLNAAAIKKKPLSPELLEECEALKINLSNVAVFLGKTVDTLTEAEVRKCVEKKKSTMTARAQTSAQTGAN